MHTPLPTKLIIILNYFKGGQGERNGSDYLEEKEIKVVEFNSRYLSMARSLKRSSHEEESLKSEHSTSFETSFTTAWPLNSDRFNI